MELTAEQEAHSQRIEEILVQKDEDGEYVYTKNEVRDFIVASIFEMDLPMDERLEKVLLGFCEQFELPEDITDAQLIEVMKEYFVEYPLNPALLKEFDDFGRNVLLTRDEGYKDASTKLDTLQSTGKEDGTGAAPLANPEKKASVKPKRGLS
ncbi:MAG: hypothetical protein GY822_08485 [Deltaproteobacteria bacterium]|nr:hypothetical protein [Deltaproteobacteria bacterium]